jgi:DNA-binding CsgD family transcriptional regulator
MVSDNVYKQTQAIWTNTLKNHPNTDSVTAPFSQPFFSQLMGANRTAVSIFNCKNYTSEFLSPNSLDVLGYSHQENLDANSSLFFGRLAPEHIDFPITASNWLSQNLDMLKKEGQKCESLCYYGVKFYHPQKKWIRLLIQHYFYETDEAGNPVRSLMLFRDVSHLVKDNFYWFRMTYSDNEHPALMKYYHQRTHNTVQKDILSVREKEILQLFAEGEETTAIAKKLFISVNTVNNHRQNMLNRVGVKDTTALMQLAHDCDLMKKGHSSMHHFSKS